MKIRNGFVSNSSSSSFIISCSDNKDVTEFLESLRIDYYTVEGNIYTEMVSDATDDYIEICNKFPDCDTNDGGNEPYDCDNYVEVEGELGISSVYIPLYIAKRNNLYPSQEKLNEIYSMVKSFIQNNGITCEDDIYKEDMKDSVYWLVEYLCSIVGYNEED